MSDGTKRPWAEMKYAADTLIGSIHTYFDRIEIAGSLRRKEKFVGDIEIVAIPRLYDVEIDLFGDTETHAYFDEWIHEKTGHQWFLLHKNGDKYKQFSYDFEGHERKVDLFLQPDPQTWGVNMMIRTGSWQFSRWMVTPKRMGGAMPDEYRVQNARVWRNGVALDTPREEDVFDLFGMDWIEPEKRNGVPNAVGGTK